jgi:predicted dehydrogenase
LLNPVVHAAEVHGHPGTGLALPLRWDLARLEFEAGRPLAVHVDVKADISVSCDRARPGSAGRAARETPGVTLRIGFAGTGIIAWAHSLALQAMIEVGAIDASIVACHDIDPDRCRGFADRCEAGVVPDVDALVRQVDVLYICTPTSAHRDAVDAALAGGVPIFCEKPLAISLAEAEALCGAVAAAKLPAQVGLVLRSIPVFEQLAAIVQSGELGRPMAVLYRDDQYFPNQGNYGSSWRADVSVAGGGALIEHSIHDVDILRHCFGEVASVSGTTANFAGHEGIEDVATGVFRHPGGVTSSLVSVWHQVLSRGSTRRVEVFLEHGMVWLDNDIVGPLTIQTSDGVEERATPLAPWVLELPLADSRTGLVVRSYAAADRAFVEAIDSGAAPAPTFADALTAHRMVDALYRSAAEGGSPVQGPF